VSVLETIEFARALGQIDELSKHDPEPPQKVRAGEEKSSPEPAGSR
jgi:hypothetical protein